MLTISPFLCVQTPLGNLATLEYNVAKIISYEPMMFKSARQKLTSRGSFSSNSERGTKSYNKTLGTAKYGVVINAFPKE